MFGTFLGLIRYNDVFQGVSWVCSFFLRRVMEHQAGLSMVYLCFVPRCFGSGCLLLLDVFS